MGPEGHKQLRQRQQPCGSQTAANPTRPSPAEPRRPARPRSRPPQKSSSPSRTPRPKSTARSPAPPKTSPKRSPTARPSKAGHHRDFPADGGWCAEGHQDHHRGGCGRHQDRQADHGDVRETAKTVTSTFETLADGVKTTTQTVTETLTDGTETQKQVITEVYDDIVDGALVTIEKVKTVAADGTVQVAEQIKSPARTPSTACGRSCRPKQIPAFWAPSMICTPPSRIRTGWASASGWRAPSTAV